MKWQGELAVFAGAMLGAIPLAVLGGVSAQAASRPSTISGADASVSPWGKPIEVQGLSAPNKLFVRSTDSISCVSPGDCAATGIVGGLQAFVVSESKGHWGKAIMAPGLGALNRARTAS